MDRISIEEALSRYNFYHIIQLNDEIATPGNQSFVPTQQLCMKHLKSLDLRGKRVLDIGCRDGLFSFAAESMGASEVIGIDNDISKPATEFLIPFFKSKIKMVQMNLYDLRQDMFGLFEVVIFPGVLYHLRYPFWGLKAIRDVMQAGGRLIIETPIWEGEPNNAMLFCPTGGDSPYEPTSCTFFNEKGLVDTMTSLGFKTTSVEYLHGMKGRPDIRGRFDDPGNPPPIREVTRCVFDLTFLGNDVDSFIVNYWEKTHDYHTKFRA